MANSTDIQATSVGRWVQVTRDRKRLLEDRFKMAQRATDTLRQRRRQVREAYHGHIARRVKGRANFHFHKVFSQIEMESARFLLNFFRHTPFATVNPTSSDTVEAAKRHEWALQFYQEKCPTFFLEQLRLIKYSTLFGCAFQIPSWRRNWGTVKKSVPIQFAGETVGYTEVESEELLYDGLWYKTFSPDDVYPHPYSRSVETMPWLIIEEFIPIQELLRRAEMGMFDKAQVNKVPLNAYRQADWEARIQQSSIHGRSMDQDIELICLQHSFEPDRFETLANGEIMIRDAKNEFWHKQIPAIMGVKTIDPDSLWPIGTGKNMLPNQKLLNLFMNEAANQAIASHWPIWKYRDGSGVNPNSLLSLPNQRIKVKNMDDVDIVQMPEMKQDLLAIKLMLEANTEELTGYFGPQKGEGSSSRTATSDAIFQQEGNMRIQSDVLTFEQVSGIPQAKMASKLVQQFMMPGTEVRINGPGSGLSFVPLSPEQIRGEFEFQVAGASEALNRAVVQQQLIEMFDTSAQAVQHVQMPNGQIVPMPVFDTYQGLKEIYEGYGRRNTDKLLYRPEIFGIPLNNDLLGQFGLPAIPGLDQLQVHPRTGAMRNDQAMAQLTNMSASDPGAPVKQANQVNAPANNPGRVV